MNSRERLIRAIDVKDVDITPCSFMLFKGLWEKSSSYLEFVQNQLALGLDAYLQIPPRNPGTINDHYNLHGLPVSFDDAVETTEWVEYIQPEINSDPMLIREYRTPGGVLTSRVRQTSDWPYGDHVPFLDDHLVPRSDKFLVEDEEDLDALSYLLVEPSLEEINAFYRDSAEAITYAREERILLAGGWGVGADLIGWIFGLNNMLFAVYDKPDFIKALLEMIGEWNRKRMEVILKAGVDLYIKRAWYENCDFWTPATYLEFIVPELEKDIRLAREYGTRFGYLITSNVMPLLGHFAELGLDVLIGVDPMGWDLVETKKKLDGKVCLWGGVNGHLTVEQGTPDQVREEVHRAKEVLSPGGGFILSPVDNVRTWTPIVEDNVHALLEEWQKLSR